MPVDACVAVKKKENVTVNREAEKCREVRPAESDKPREGGVVSLRFAA